jgi:acyl-CoA-dependent ceramide synthase
MAGLRLSSDGGVEVWSNIFQSFLNPNAETIGLNPGIQYTFLGLLLGLQCITLMWLIMIIKVVIRVLRGEGADDSRSDAEDEDEEELDELEDAGAVQPSVPFTLNEPQQKFIEVEADSTELSHSYVRRSGSGSKSRPKSKGSGGFSSGLNLGERKDILNRIGCLSEEQLAREREKMGENSVRPGSGGR